MFRNTQRFFNGRSREYSTPITFDDDGYIDKECPNEECMSKFKIFGDDWKDKVSDEKVFCPFCGYSAPARSWFTTEQVEQAKQNAIAQLENELMSVLRQDAADFNRQFGKKGLITLSMSVSGPRYRVTLPAAALEEMQQKITCEYCGTRYEVIGAAFFCPCCGKNSAQKTFENTMEKVRSKIMHLDKIKSLLDDESKDESAMICASLVESSVNDLVVALQRLCESVYAQVSPSKQLKKNVFQRLSDGSDLWKDYCGEGYQDWVTDGEYKALVRCFQQRHILQHKDGLVDEEYLRKSGDNTYLLGQRLVIHESDVLAYEAITRKIGERVLSFVNKAQ